MPRIIGVDVPGEKRLFVALTYIYGIGRSRAEQILSKLNIDKTKKAKELTDEELARLNNYLSTLPLEGRLRREISQNIQRLKSINCYRGIRHKRGLPVRGQRTRTNARTRKGPRKTVAGKKKAPAPK